MEKDTQKTKRMKPEVADTAAAAATPGAAGAESWTEVKKKTKKTAPTAVAAAAATLTTAAAPAAAAEKKKKMKRTKKSKKPSATATPTAATPAAAATTAAAAIEEEKETKKTDAAAAAAATPATAATPTAATTAATGAVDSATSAAGNIMKAMELLNTRKPLTTINADYKKADRYAKALDDMRKSHELAAVHKLKVEPWYITTWPELHSGKGLNVDVLLERCTASMFGRAGETVLDETVRRSRELVLLPDAYPVAPWLLKAVANVAAKTFGKNIRVEADKLVVYAVGDHFDEHRDTVRSLDHVGTAVYVLPGTDHEGGDLVFPTEDVRLEAGMAVFHTDVPHRVDPVTYGKRVSMTFRVFRTGPLELDEFDIDCTSDTDDNGNEEKDEEYTDEGIMYNKLRRNHNVFTPGVPWQLDDEEATKPTFTGGFLAVREHVAAVMASAAGKEHIAAYPPFAETTFAKLLQEDMAEGKSVLLECFHRVPAAAMADWRNLRGVDLELAKLIAGMRLQVRLVSLLIDAECLPSEYFEEFADIERKIEVHGESEWAPLLRNVVYAHVRYANVHLVMYREAGDHTGNESAPGELQYVCAAMLVSVK